MITLKGILIFTGGAVVGAIGSWYYCKRTYERILEEHETELEKLIRAEYGDVDAFVETDEDEETSVPADETGRRGSFATDYTSFYKVDPAESEHPTEEGDTKGSKKRAPRIIKADDFGEDGFAQIYLDFYTEDKALVITDETEAKEVDEVRDWIGNALEKYGFESNDEEKIYVRNFNRKEDYEILKVWDRFSPPEAYD
jgi:hypothetical protein